MTGKQMGPFQSVLNFVTDHQILRIPVKGQFMRGGIQGNGRFSFILIFFEIFQSLYFCAYLYLIDLNQ